MALSMLYLPTLAVQPKRISGRLPSRDTRTFEFYQKGNWVSIRIRLSTSFACSQFPEPTLSHSVESDELTTQEAVLSKSVGRDCGAKARGQRPGLFSQVRAGMRPFSLESWPKIFQSTGSPSKGVDAGGCVGSLSGLLLNCALVGPGVGLPSTFQPPSTVNMHDVLAGFITMCGAVGFLQFFKELTKRDIIDQKLSRKLVHISVGLGFMLFWPLFTVSPLAPYLAAFAVAANTLHILAVGLGLLQNEEMVKSLSRFGNPRELLKGPFYYGTAITLATVVFWRTSPVGILAVVTLCAGDGFADVIGREFGKSKLFYNEEKSYAGSAGFFVMSLLLSIVYFTYFSAFGFLKILPGTLFGVLMVSLISAIVESLPISSKLDDNLTVPLAAVISGLLFLPHS